MTTKPTLSSFNTLAEIMIQTYERYLPTSFDESLTILEKLNKVINYLDQMGKINNEIVTQWNEVMVWVMADGLTDSVNTKLDEMATDGTLSQIINVDMMGSLVNLQTTDKTSIVSAINENTVNINENVKKIPHFARYQIEKAGDPHIDGLAYTAFFSGASVNGKEVHVGRVGTGHTGFTNELVVYIRENDGTFTRKKIEGNINYTLGDFRDPNLFYSPITKKTYLSISVKKTDGTYTNLFCEMNDQFDVSTFYEITGMENYFTWGNSIPSSDGKTLRLAYDTLNVNNGVHLFKSGAISGNTIGFSKIAEIFPASLTKPTEATMTQWGEKLIVVARQNTGNMLYRETYDLTGVTGWGDIVDLGFKGDAPVMPVFIPKSKPLVIGRSIGGSDYQRSPLFNLTYDLKNYTSSLFVDKLTGFGGGYHSLVPNRNGFGIMYYQDGSDPSQENATTNVFYREMDIHDLLKDELDYLESITKPIVHPKQSFRNNEIIYGDSAYVDSLFASNGSGMEMSFEVKQNYSIKGIELLTANDGTISATLELYENGSLIATSNGVSVSTSTKTTYSFVFPTNITLTMGKTYMIKVVGTIKVYTKAFKNNFGTVDFGDFVYKKTRYNATDYPKNVVPFGLIRNV